MPIMKNILGLDLGSHSLKAVELRQTLRGIEAIQLATQPRPEDETPLADLVQEFVRFHHLTTDHVVTALRGDRISSRRPVFPFSDPRKLTQAVPFAVEGDLPFDLEEVAIDWEIAGGERSATQVVASIASRSDVADLLATLDKAGCPPRILEAEGLVLGNLAALFELDGTRLLVDLGHSKTTFCLLVQGRAIAARSVPVGGRHLTEAIARDRGLSLEEAERLKCEEGIFRDGLDSAPPLAVAVLDRIAHEALRTLGSLESVLSGLGAGPVEELTIFGGSALLDRLDSYLTERTGVRTARLGLPRAGEGAGLVAGGSPIQFAPAIALALRGTSRARTRMNYRRDEFAVRLDFERILRDFRSTGWIAAAALLLSVGSFASGAILDARRARILEGESSRLYAEAFPGQPAPGNAVAALREEVRQATDRAEFLGVYRGNLSALDLLTELSRRIPSSLDIVFEELSIDRQTIRMRVHAKSFQAADQLGAELAKFPPFAGTRIGAIETDRKTGVKRFNVTISLASSEDRA
jgi:type IV pilus assembly protein PilM